MGNQAAGAVSSKDEATRGCQYTAATAAMGALVAMSPFRLCPSYSRSLSDSFLRSLCGPLLSRQVPSSREDRYQ